MQEHHVAVPIAHSAPWVSQEDIEAVSDVLRAGMIASGSKALEFESACLTYLDASHVEFAPSGLAALERAINLLGLDKSKTIVIPTYVCDSVRQAVTNCGYRPVFCDVGDAWCITADSVGEVFDSSVGAIIAVHMFGIKMDVKSLSVFGVPVIEDCAQCFSDFVGSDGDLAVYSFNATKCLTTGEGGLIAIPKKSGIDKSASKSTSAHQISDLQASLGVSQLSRYADFLDRRLDIANYFFSVLDSSYLERLSCVRLRSIFFRFPLYIDDGYSRLSKAFTREGVSVRRGVDTLLHRNAGLSDSLFPNAVEAFSNTISIPCYPALNDGAVYKIAEVTRRVVNEV